MKLWAVVENDKPLVCLERPDPVPVGREVLVRVSHCGVCHSDLHFVHGVFDLGGGKTLRITDRGVKLPCAPGHEIVGTVVALGPEASGVAIGDQRIVYPWIGCGECELCNSDNENLCYTPRGLGVIQDGGFGSHIVVPNETYLFAFDGIDPAVAATFPCSGLTVYSAIQKAMPLDPAKAVLVVGAGGLGLVAVRMLRALGFAHVIVADLSAEKRTAALEAGASAAIDNSAGDAQEQVAAAGGGLLQAAFDFVNVAPTVALALEALGKQGKLVLVGVGGGELPLSLAGLIFRPRTIMGTITGNRRHLAEVIALAQSGRFVPFAVTRMPKDSANEALALLDAGKVVGRIVLEDC
ncbi:alcohol dehydrogenase [Novosphingobium colocasiae]|uniref:alcohol dehydrogenase n=1 Tax=Novosphingobium colocasiae TaxID=1256513 RepID=A0A918UD30_9SPHN|nr:alcohol dehydrogenase [Novosphingobium colocasiae]GGY91980.1 NAD-dependent alcohol dehydrogenase [Novosphingobium colocasiae]